MNTGHAIFSLENECPEYWPNVCMWLQTFHQQTPESKIELLLGQNKLIRMLLVPPLDHFQGKNKNFSSLARTISASFFANLTTFERRSGLKKISLLKIAILKMG